MDCSFLQRDGSKPPILREAGPKQTDVLFCLSDVDQNNIIASLVGSSLGFKRVMTRIQDHEFEPICSELELTNTINPQTLIFDADGTDGSCPTPNRLRLFCYPGVPQSKKVHTFIP